MNYKTLITVGKWIVMSLLLISNLLYYLHTGSMLNLVLSLAIVAYSIYEFFHLISLQIQSFSMKLFLSTFFIMALVNIFLGTKSLLLGDFSTVIINLAIITGDIVFILFSIHKSKKHNND